MVVKIKRCSESMRLISIASWERASYTHEVLSNVGYILNIHAFNFRIETERVNKTRKIEYVLAVGYMERNEK